MGVVAVLAVALTAAPLTLDAALAFAAKRNPLLQAARADVEAAGANVQFAYGGVLPTLDLSAGLGGQKIETADNSSSGGFHDVALDLRQPVFHGLSNWRTIDAQRTRDTAAQRQLDEITRQVAFNVTRAYYEVVKQKHALEVRQGTAELSQQLVSRADALFTGGRGTRADTYSARANLENDQIAVQTQEGVLESARADLAVAIGLESSVGLDVVPPFPVAGPELPALDEPPPLPSLLAVARKERPLVSSLRLASQAAQTDIQVAQGAYWPAIDLVGSLSRTATDFSGGSNGLFAAPSHLYTVVGQVRLTWNIYAGGQTRAGVSLARSAANRADAALSLGEQQVAAEVEVARAQVVTLARSASALKPLLDASENSLRFARELLDLGRSSQLEVRDAALKVEQARLVWVQTVADLVVARANLARAVGAPQ